MSKEYKVLIERQEFPLLSPDGGTEKVWAITLDYGGFMGKELFGTYRTKKEALAEKKRFNL